MSVAAASSWDSKFKLNNYCIREIEFWENCLKQLNSRELYKVENLPHYAFYSDAKVSGCGAHMLLNGKKLATNTGQKEKAKVTPNGENFLLCPGIFYSIIKSILE